MILTKHEFLARFASEYCCKFDAPLTLVGDTSGLAYLLGYSAGELTELYQNSLAAIVSADVRYNLYQIFTEQLADHDEIECIFPVRHKSGKVLWLLTRAARQNCEDGSSFIHGILVEISKLKQAYDSEKDATQAWEEEAKKDSLTHIYNAYTTRKLAESYIKESAELSATLLIIDLDDFKQVNDQYGHLFGDAVLVQTAKIIKNLFRSEDIVGRIGGEEFMVLMKGTADLTIIHNRCTKLNEALRSMFGKELPMCKPSCSIGVALFPQHATSYFGLFRCADRALYHAKALGKKQYALYDESNCSMTQGGDALRYGDYDEKTLRGYIETDKELLTQS